MIERGERTPPTLAEFKALYDGTKPGIFQADESAWQTFYRYGLPALLFRWRVRYGDQAGFFGWGRGKWCWPSQWTEKYYESRFPPATYNREKFVLPSKPAQKLKMLSRLDVISGQAKLHRWGLPFRALDRDGWFCWWHLGWWKRLMGTL